MIKYDIWPLTKRSNDHGKEKNVPKWGREQNDFFVPGNTTLAIMTVFTARPLIIDFGKNKLELYS